MHSETILESHQTTAALLVSFGLVTWGMIVAVRRWRSFYSWMGLSSVAAIFLLCLDDTVRLMLRPHPERSFMVPGSRPELAQPAGTGNWWDAASDLIFNLAILGLGISIVGICYRLRNERQAGDETSAGS